MIVTYHCRIVVIDIACKKFELFFVSSWSLCVENTRILPLAQDPELRIMLRLRFSFTGTKISKKPLGEFSSNKWGDAVLSWSPETAAVLITQKPIQEGSVTSASTQCSIGKEEDGGSQVWKEGWVINRSWWFILVSNNSSSRLHQPNNCCTVFLPTVRNLHLHFGYMDRQGI